MSEIEWWQMVAAIAPAATILVFVANIMYESHKSRVARRMEALANVAEAATIGLRGFMKPQVTSIYRAWPVDLAISISKLGFYFSRGRDAKFVTWFTESSKYALLDKDKKVRIYHLGRIVAGTELLIASTTSARKKMTRYIEKNPVPEDGPALPWWMAIDDQTN